MINLDKGYRLSGFVVLLLLPSTELARQLFPAEEVFVSGLFGINRRSMESCRCSEQDVELQNVEGQVTVAGTYTGQIQPAIWRSLCAGKIRRSA